VRKLVVKDLLIYCSASVLRALNDKRPVARLAAG
jgi:hypothetical protein